MTPVRVHAPAGEPPHALAGHNRPDGYRRVCGECGDPFTAAERHGAFCTTPCRTAWNNRRRTRGAELYDLMMACRYERGIAKAMKLWSLVCRMAAGFRAEDREQRAGRKSWREAREVISSRPYLTATIIQAPRKKRERS